jgi:tetratricopeptide (TPR) repeat protein
MRERTINVFATRIVMLIDLAFLAGLSPASEDADVETIDQQVRQLEREGRYSEAVPLAVKLLDRCEQLMGKENPATAVILDKLAKLYDAGGEYAKAEPLFQRALRIFENAPGPDDVHTAATLNNLAELYRHVGAYGKAEFLYERVLKIDENIGGLDGPNSAATLNNLGLVYTATGRYAKAEGIFARALAVAEKHAGPEHTDTAVTYNNLAHLYEDMGDYARAEPLYLRALKIAEKALGAEHPNIATLLSGLGTLYLHKGDIAKAEPLFVRALKISEKTLGPEHPSTAQGLNNLAALYEDVGDYATAQPLYERSLKIRETVLGQGSPDTATSLNNLAGLSRTIGNYAKAESLYQRSLRIYEQCFGAEHTRVALGLNNLADLYGTMGVYSKAEPLYLRALRIDEVVMGEDHADVATIVNNLGWLYHHTGDYGKAELFFHRSIRISEKALGHDHPQTATGLRNLAYLYFDEGRMAEASELVSRVSKAEEKYLADVLSFTSERQRLAFQQTANPYSLPARLKETELLAQTILRRKGVVLDSLLEDRLISQASEKPEQREVIIELLAAKQRLMQVSLQAPNIFAEDVKRRRDIEKQQLSNRVDELEARLARQVAGLGKARRALSITVEQVQADLGRNEALIELARYNEYLGKNKWEWRYGAILITPDSKPVWCQLGSAVEIEKNIKLYQECTRGDRDEATLIDVLHALHAQVWTPIEKFLPTGTTTVAVSPDGELNFVSFATLIDSDDTFLAEQYSIRYLASGRDLLRDKKSRGTFVAVIFANPDFEGKNLTPNSAHARANTVALRSIEMRDLQNISLPPLPGTAREAAALEVLVGKQMEKPACFLGLTPLKRNSDE